MRKPQNVCQAIAESPVTHAGAATLGIRDNWAQKKLFGAVRSLEVCEHVILWGGIQLIGDRRRHQHERLISHELP
jgi:hypothetical protein